MSSIIMGHYRTVKVQNCSGEFLSLSKWDIYRVWRYWWQVTSGDGILVEGTWQVPIGRCAEGVVGE